MLLVLSLLLAVGCKPELTIADATNKIDIYFFYFGDLYMLGSLGLMTTSQVESVFDLPKDYLPTGEILVSSIG